MTSLTKKAVETYKLATFAVAALLLGGCGGSSAVSGRQDITALDQIDAAIGQLQTKHPAGSYTPLSTLAVTTGTVTYEGFMRSSLANTSDTVTDVLAGQVDIAVAFDSPEMVDGTAHSFVDEDGNSMSGQLTLSGGALNLAGDPTSDFTFQFDGDGQLQDSSGRQIDLEVSFDGDFLGATAEAIGGDVTGTATVGGNAQSLQGLFVVEIPSP